MCVLWRVSAQVVSARRPGVTFDGAPSARRLHGRMCNELRAPGDYSNKGERSGTHELPTHQRRPTRERATARAPTRHDPESDHMKAIAVHPGTQNSVHLTDLPMPSLDEIPDGRGVLVRLLRCGVDGTDKEINTG